MLLLGHTGLTLGVATLLAGALPEKNTAPHGKGILARIEASFTSLAHRVDIRILVIGSMLPDIIDKPVGQVIFKDIFSNGRIFSHTLLFLLLVSLVGWYVYRRYKSNWGLVLAFGTLTHLIFDEMWRAPGTLFWPFLGLAFDKEDLTHWLDNIFWGLLTNPSFFVPEVLGGLVILFFGVMLLQRRKVWAFIRRGRIAL